MVFNPSDLGDFRRYGFGGTEDLFYPAVSFSGHEHCGERKRLGHTRKVLCGLLSGSVCGVLSGGRFYLEKILEYAGGKGGTVLPVLGMRVPDCKRAA